MKREAYRTVDVKQVSIESLVADKPALAAVVGIDVAKSESLAVVRWQSGDFERPWRVQTPEDIPVLVDRFRDLAQGRPTLIAMESTGTYGDALRQALTDAGLAVHRVSGKAVHDYAEIFDGVPSQHDGKDAAIVAELATLGKSSPWPYRPPTEFDQELRYWVERADAQQRIGMLWLGRLEALLARHWPEATQYLELSSETLLQVLAEYGGPAALAADSGAVKRLKGWGGHFLKSEKIERFVRAAAQSVGVRQTAVDRRRAQEYAAAVLATKHEVQKASATMENWARSHAIIARQAAVVGWTTACVLWVHQGDPRNYHCAEAYRKAMGLNLKERSSGRYKGQLKISKRGPGAVRRWLYFAAMRLVQTAAVAEWYEVKKGQRAKGGGRRALVAVMRKLALGLHALGVSEESFDARRLFSPTVKRSRRLAQQAKKQLKQEQAKERRKQQPKQKA
jgi:transposase